jgi:hypothetical protein
MIAYRLYCLDGAGHIGLADWLRASNDHDAIRQARRAKRGARRCEVWQGNRLVTVLDAHDLRREFAILAGASSAQAGADLGQ